MRVYVAAPWVRRAEAIAVGGRFERAGHEVTSRWFKHKGEPNDNTGILMPRLETQHQAYEDIADVRRSNVLVVLNLEKSEGKACETGMAIILGIPVISVGPRSHIFQALGVEVETVTEALDIVYELSGAKV